MANNFYDKVAHKFGAYNTEARYFREFSNGDPEGIFKEKLIELSGKDKTVLDSGCADGRFTLSIAPYFKKIIAIDNSKGMLESANKLKKEKGILNVEFVFQDLFRIEYDSEFDLIYNRRGPTDHQKFYKALKRGGYYIEIDIGERDAMEIKKAFGRGQNFGDWDKSTLKKRTGSITKAGFRIIFSGDYIYDEFYSTLGDLDLFLQSVPIFKDYNSKKDIVSLKKYASEFTSEKGINLPRHRVVVLAQK